MYVSHSFLDLFLFLKGVCQTPYGSSNWYLTGVAPTSVTTGDFNKDTNPDVAIANHNDNSISVLIGNGDGTSQDQIIYTVGIFPRSTTVGVFKSIEKLDRVVANYWEDSITILLNSCL